MSFLSQRLLNCALPSCERMKLSKPKRKTSRRHFASPKTYGKLTTSCEHMSCLSVTQESLRSS
ncbi:hypothetical protein M404DRAFT_923127 [Pisolithus tinctorius Marx 270]|uniref:Uncharacterized protein n=1 Tax=Pisolithus tinctorius Marx 270 TaxID=870435 RepID=A0A0C3NMT5_PISTI|nr:hypothetical protein M404DRAFT_923127 [Pisolithus tinctorius Marx 270]